MNKKTIYKSDKEFYETLEMVLYKGENVHSSMHEGLRVYLYKGKQYEIYENLDLGVYSYIIISW